jgi:alpha-mannosidase
MRFLLASLLLTASGLFAAESLVWRIGAPDVSYLDFRGPANATYRIGRDSPAAWPREQDASGHPTIVFQLAAAPDGPLELRVHLLFHNSAIPRFGIEVNGRRGEFVLSPEKTVPGYRDQNYIPYFGKQGLILRLPASFYRQGDNEIRFNVVDLGTVLYDSVELYAGAAAPPAPCDIAARLLPTVFWKKENGELREQVELIVRPGVACGAGAIETTIGGRRYEHKIPGDYSFGDVTSTFLVPDAGQGADAAIRVSVGGCRKEIRQRFIPARKWKLYVASTTHFDLGYTTRQPEALNLHLDNLKSALDVMERHPEVRWDLEGAWLADRYRNERGETEARRLLGAAAGGRLGTNALHSNLQASLMSLEEWNRASELGYEFGKLANTPMDFASLADVPSLPLEMPTVLRQAGIRYVANGANQWRAPMLHNGRLDERSPVLWEGPDGSRVLCWFIRGYAHSMFLFGVPGSEARALATLGHYLASYPASYAYDAVLIYGLGGDNALLGSDANAAFHRDWNARYEYPRMVPARFRDFFDYIESRGTNRLEVIRGDGGAYWDDGVIESPRTFALNRRNQAEAVEMETLASLALLREPTLRYPAETLKSIWNNILLFDEHTFGMQGSVVHPDFIETRAQWAIKSGYALRAASDLAWGRNQWLSRITGTGDRAVVVWNPSSWRRTDWVEVEIPGRKYLAETAGGARLPVETIKEDGGRRIVRFLAKDIPPLNYGVYPLVSVAPPAAVPEPANTLENEYYRITFDATRAGIGSIVDKITGRELVNATSPYALGELLRGVETSQRRELDARGSYDSAVRTRLDANGYDLPAPVLKVERPAATGAARIVRTALGSIGRIEARAESTPRVELEARLWNGVRRIDLIARIHRPRVEYHTTEALYIAFPFNIEAPSFSYDRPLGWVNPATGMMPGAASSWYGAANGVNVSGTGVSLTLATPDAPMVMFGDIDRGLWPTKPILPADATVLSYVYNNHWLTNFAAGQEYGDYEFRYSLTGACADRASQTRFGEQARHPLVAMTSSGAAAPADVPVEVASDDIHLVTMKQAPRSPGYLLRLAEASGKPGEALVRFKGWKPRAARLTTTHGETVKTLAIESNAVRVPLAGYGMATLIVE